jgi:spoIIIJ-associated protein
VTETPELDGELVEDPAVSEDAPTGEADGQTDGEKDGGTAPKGGGRVRALEQEGEVAADYLEALLDIIDVDGDLDLDVEGDRAVVAIVGERLDPLVGRAGETLEALQELTRLAVHTATGSRSRLMLDIGGFRAKRRTELTSLGEASARRVAESGELERLAPMNPFERKVVHDAVAKIDGAMSESEGDEPQRRVVVLPVGSA